MSAFSANFDTDFNLEEELVEQEAAEIDALEAALSPNHNEIVVD
ncbi:hypothetical protein [Streptomyces sp. NPDC001286]